MAVCLAWKIDVREGREKQSAEVEVEEIQTAAPIPRWLLETSVKMSVSCGKCCWIKQAVGSLDFGSFWKRVCEIRTRIEEFENSAGSFFLNQSATNICSSFQEMNLFSTFHTRLAIILVRSLIKTHGNISSLAHWKLTAILVRSLIHDSPWSRYGSSYGPFHSYF